MISQEAIKERAQAALEAINKQIELPIYLRAAIPALLAKLPEELSRAETRQNLIDILQLVGWVAGYRVSYEEEAALEALDDKNEL